MTEEQRARILRRFEEICSSSIGPTMGDVEEMNRLADLLDSLNFEKRTSPRVPSASETLEEYFNGLD